MTEPHRIARLNAEVQAEKENHMNPLEQYPAIRKHLYLAQWVVNLILGVIGVVLVALGESPLWFVITTAAFNFVWSYTGVTAQSNVSAE